MSLAHKIPSPPHFHARALPPTTSHGRQLPRTIPPAAGDPLQPLSGADPKPSSGCPSPRRALAPEEPQGHGAPGEAPPVTPLTDALCGALNGDPLPQLVFLCPGALVLPCSHSLRYPCAFSLLEGGLETLWAAQCHFFALIINLALWCQTKVSVPLGPRAFYCQRQICVRVGGEDAGGSGRPEPRP